MNYNLELHWITMPCSLLCDSCSGARIWRQHDSGSQTSQTIMTFGLFSNDIVAEHSVEPILTVYPEEIWEIWQTFSWAINEQKALAAPWQFLRGWSLVRQKQLSLANLSPEGESNLSCKWVMGKLGEGGSHRRKLWKRSRHENVTIVVEFKGAIIFPRNCRATPSRGPLCLL